MKRENFKGKKVTVIGLGESGFASASLLLKEGASVFVSDSSSSPEIGKRAALLKREGADVELGRHTKDFVIGSSLIVKSPGVLRGARPLLWAAREGTPVIGEIELGSYFCRADIIAVTGTNGKSTTTTLIGEILKAAGRKVFVCGNIGRPLCADVENMKEGDIVALEMSSFQLEEIRHFRPRVALVLNISPNHLDRHTDLKEYSQSKARIFMNQAGEDIAILNYDDEIVRGFAGKGNGGTLFFSRQKKVRGAFMKNGEMVLNLGAQEEKIMEADEVPLVGEHNVENVLAAVLACAIYNIEPASIASSIRNFNGLEHRFEYIGSISGRHFINDSKATSVDATCRALLSSGTPVILIAGGRDKNADFSQIRGLIRERVKAAVLIGEAREKLKAAFCGATQLREASTLREAVKLAYDISSRGDSILLSPMCTSFDMFGSFEERGLEFKRAFAQTEKSCAEFA